jgi:hypothetical protein
MYSNQSLAKLSDLASTVAEIYTSTQIQRISSPPSRLLSWLYLSPLVPKIRCILDFLAGWKK